MKYAFNQAMKYNCKISMKQMQSNRILITLLLVFCLINGVYSTTCAAVNGIQYYQQPDTTCAPTCPSTTYKNNNNFQCTACSNTCNGCSNTATNCNVCAGSHFRVIGSTSCTNDCGAGYYGSSTTVSCTICPIGCAVCSQSGGSITCSECASVAGIPYYYLSNGCTSICPTTQYGGVDGSSKPACVACTAPCATCLNSGTVCTSCASDRLIAGTNTCGSCPGGQWAESSTTCGYCNQNCLTCSGTADTCNSCGVNSGGNQMYKLVSNNKCYFPCPFGHIHNTTSSNCQSCDTSCSGCSTTKINCIDCNTVGGYFRKIGSNECTNNCGDGYYKKQANYQCTVCPLGCKLCSETTSVLTCSECRMVAGLQYYLQDNQCVSICTNITYTGFVSTLPECISCNGNCATCSGTATFCTSCSSGRLIVNQNTCGACPAGQYNSAATTCGLCDSNCKTCTALLTCTDCPFSSIGHQTFLHTDAKCYNTCPSGFYGVVLTRLCTECDTSCFNCTGTATNCITCKTSANYFRKIGSSECTLDCGDGYFRFTGNYLCTLCPYGCKTCVETSLTVITCTECSSVAGIQFYLLGGNCLSSCPNTTYPGADSANSNKLSCVACNVNCATCLIYPTFCTTCTTDRLIVNSNTCGACIAGQYNSGGNTCALCDSSCKTCTALTTCTDCPFNSIGYQTFLHTDAKCYSPCPTGFYGVVLSRLCVGCHQSCLNCTNSATNCQTCNQAGGYFRKIGSNECINNCGTGYYKQTSNNLCTICPVGCKTCALTSSVVTCDECLLVAGLQYYLQSSVKCVSVCPSDKVFDYVGAKYVCTGCDVTCQTCFGIAQNSCITCVANKFLRIGNTTCSDTCVDGHYGAERKCYVCSTNCKTCITTAINCLTCGLSQEGVPLYLHNTACLTTCPNLFFAKSNNECTGCHETCFTCTGENANECLSCTTGHYDSATKTCETTCTTGFYPANNLCNPCPSICVSCSTFSICSQCKMIAGQQYFLTATFQCVIVCSNITFADITSKTCIPCDSPCLSCINQTTRCLTCTTSKLLQYGTFTCITGCPDGQYFINNTQVCLLCNVNCQTCNYTDTNCISCTLSTNGLHLYHHSNKCYETCPGNRFGNVANHICETCDASCSGCLVSSTNCIACASLYYRKVGSNECVQPCPTSYFGNEITNLCEYCPIGCYTCVFNRVNGTYYNTSCTSCSIVAGITYYLYSTTAQCMAECPVTFYEAIVSGNKICSVCESPCATCIDATKCITCLANHYLGVGSTTCHINDCPAGQFHLSGSLKCLTCNSFCLTCSGTSTTCDSCQTLGGVAYFLTNNKCSVVCPIDRYGNLNNLICTACQNGCSSCFNGTINDCYSCTTYGGQVYALIYGTYTCSVNCPSDQYKTGNLCLLCSSNCLTCVTSSTNCLTCTFSSIGSQLYLSNNKCLLTCPDNFYPAINNTCLQCTAGCATCNASGLTSCFTCKNEGADTYYKIIGKNQCTRICPGGQFILASVPNLCQLCSSVCITCENIAQNCTSSNCSINFYYLNNSCLSLCPDNYYPHFSFRQCIQCTAGCQTCYDSSLTKCTKCNSISTVKYYKQIGVDQCAENCRLGEFKNSTTQRCVLCAAACAQCTSLTVCQECQSVYGVAYHLNGNECTIACPTVKFGQISNFTCISCASGCLTCFGPSLLQCYSCNAHATTSDNYYLIYNTRFCNLTCPDGQYQNATSFMCLLCSSACKTCQINSTHCLTCGFTVFGYSLYFNDNLCLNNCPNGKWPNSTDYICYACSLGCLTCSNFGLNFCTVCGVDGSDVYYKHMDKNTCGKTCPNGQFISVSVPNICQPCSAGCVTCVNIAENCTSSTCAQNLFFLNNNCLALCPDNYFPKTDVRQCIQCTAGCQTCYDSSLTKCTKCNSISTVKYYKQIGVDQCAENCRVGEFKNSTTQRCVLCAAACAQCTSLTVCQECQSVYGVAYYLNGNECTIACPTDKFGQIPGFACIPCAQGCRTCFGPSLLQCYSCNAHATTSDNYYLIYNTRFCNLTCPDGQYQNATSFMCLLCSSACKTCQINSTHCLTCGFTVFGYNLYFYTNKCLLNCLTGFWGNPFTFNCDTCTPGCTSCFANGLTFCNTCGIDASSDIYYKHIGNTTCGKTCPNGQFISQFIPYWCQPCSLLCVTCSVTAQNCTSTTCAQNYFFLNNSCLLFCPDNYYPDTSLRQCLQCTPGCQTCSASGLDKCTKCNIFNGSQFYLQIGINTCSTICNDGEYRSPLNNKCAPCNPACKTCSSLAICLTCHAVNGLAYYRDVDICTVSCPYGKFGYIVNFVCVTCATGCQSCFGIDQFTCNKCKVETANGVSTNYYLVYGTTTCSVGCPSNQYSNSTVLKCLLCDNNCKTCVTSSGNCLTCGFSALGINLYLFNNSCLSSCPNKFWPNSTSNECDGCNPGCAICTGPTLNNCSVCTTYNNSGTLEVYLKVVGETICSLICPNGQFINPTILNNCAICDIGCIQCSISPFNCTILSCSPGYFYYYPDSSCLKICPNNFYGNTSTRVCTQCTSGCELCFGSGLFACTKCQIASAISYFKIIDVDTCTQNCPAGQYEYPLLLSCQYCSAPCLTCNITSTDCQTCTNVTGISYFNINNECLLSCPNRYYGEKSNNTCVLCTPGCNLCTGGTLLDCTKCQSEALIHYFLIAGTTQCSLSCPPGQYSNVAANSCFFCDSNCFTCDVIAKNCTTCFLTSTGIKLYLQNFICVQSCSVSKYKNQTNNTCLLCNPGCLICIGPTLNECQACKDVADSNNASIITPYYLTIGNSICDPTCPVGQYIRAGYPNLCQACSPQCIGCFAISTNCTESLLCAISYFFYRPTNACLLVCPNGYYGNGTTGYCQLCQGGCQLCTAGNLQSCTRCKTDPVSTVHYYRQIFNTWCVPDCEPGQFQVLSDFSCQLCSDPCVLCNSSSTTCQQCRNVTGVLYFYNAEQCVVRCPDGMYGKQSNNNCTICNAACRTCYGPSTTECYSCKIDNTDLSNTTYYYLSYQTTFCVAICPYGQYATNSSFTCQLCNINCATCVGTSTFCLTCDYINTINIVYLHLTKCIVTCPSGFWPNSTVAQVHQCTMCHVFCLRCTGPSILECSACKNQTINGIEYIYYKDIYSTTCDSTCKDGQYIDALFPNTCMPCNSKCLKCMTSSINCQKCGLSFFLYVPTNSCTAQCPPNYFNDPNITVNFYYCTKCTAGCLTCTGGGLTACQTCQNTTIGVANVSYFKDRIGPICTVFCSTGFYGNTLNNNCDPCQTGCITCEFSASNCFSCISAGGNDYYKTENTNSCVLVCPHGYYGNATDYSCRTCIYYTINGTCVLTCPAATFAFTNSNNRTICQSCTDPNVTGNPCNRTYTFNIQTKVVNGGRNYRHKVFLSGGLSSSIPLSKISTNLTVYVTKPSRRLLYANNRLLVVNTPLTVQNVQISADRTVITIDTNYQQFDFSVAAVVIDFPAGSLVSSDGLNYQSTTARFDLSSPIFMESLYEAFSKSDLLAAEGIIFILMSVILLAIQVIIANRKGYHEMLAFVMILQVIGILRTRQFPINFKIYGVLQGFSYFELPFLPNGLTFLFPPNYQQVGVRSLVFTFTYINYLYTIGSIVQFFIGLEICLILYYAIKSHRPQHFARMKFIQETIICIFMVLFIYFALISLASLQTNGLLTMPSVYLIGVAFSLVVLICYTIYFLFWVRPFRLFELYKIHNLCRVVGLLILSTNLYGGIITIDLFQIVFFIVDLALYRHEKLSIKAYTIEHIFILAAINVFGFSKNYVEALAVGGGALMIVFIVKIYYTIITVKDFIDYRKEQGASEIDVSDIVNISVKQKEKKSEKIKVQADKMNFSDNFIYHEESFNNLSNVESQPTKHQFMQESFKDLRGQHEEESQQEQKREDIRPEESSESQEEMIVYLDPDDYTAQINNKRRNYKENVNSKIAKKEEEARPTTSQFTFKTNRKNLRVDGMKTGANFHPKNRGQRNHQIIEEDIEVIKVEPNVSEIDKESDIVSDNSEGYGWLQANDQRNIARQRLKKSVWKIVDVDQQPSPKKKN